MTSTPGALGGEGANRPWLHACRQHGVLVAIGAFLILALGIAAGVEIWTDRERAIGSAEGELMRLSVTLAESTSRTLQGVDLILLDVEERIAVEGVRTPEELREAFSSRAAHDFLVDRIHNVPFVDALGIVGSDGRVINFTRAWPIPDVSVADRDYFVAHRDTSDGEPFVGKAVRNRSSGEWTMFLSRRLQGPDGAFLGVLVGTIKTRYFEDFYQTVAPGLGSTVSLYRRDGILLARHPPSEAFIGQSFAERPLFKRLEANLSAGVFQSEAGGVIEPRVRIMALRAVPNYPLIVSVGNVRETILADWRRRTIAVLAMSAVAAVLIALSGMLLARQFDFQVRMARSQAAREQAQTAETRIRELNATLEANLRQLRAITDNLPVLIIYSDAQRIIRFINKTGELWLARPAKDMVGKSFAEILNRLPIVDSKTLFDRLSKGPVRFERTVRHPDGKLRILDAIDVPDVGADGKIRGYFSLRVDITERRATEAQIRELNSTLEANLGRLRAITDNLPVVIAYVDIDRKIRFVNRVGAIWYARPTDDIVGKSFAEIMNKPTLIDSRTLFETLSKGPYRYERTSQFPDGKIRTVDVVDVPDIALDGTIRGYYVLGTDVTERRDTEEQLRQAQKLEAIGKLTGGLAHDFNNLLAIISGNLELAAEDLAAGDRDVGANLQNALRATERGATLTRSLLAFARQQPLSPVPIDLNALVRDMIELIRRTVPENIAVTHAEGYDLWACEADPGQLQNALLNLVVNARDAMPAGGRLAIETSNVTLDSDYAAANAEVAPGPYVVLAVSDTGTGMTPEVMARAFEPFFSTKSIGQGTGLGLSMVYGFAKQSNGHAKIYSEVGHGTVVTIYLPRSGYASEVPVVARAAGDIRGRGETVLVVEDNPDVRSLVATQLHSLGYEVLAAETPSEALLRLREPVPIALLLTDVVLPGDMNGSQLADEALRVRPALKVLYMSGYAESAMLHGGRLDHGVSLLQKPFSKQMLASKVRGILDGMRTGA